jgi:hypothetical protein
MALETYNYSKQVNIITLRKEIEASPIITVALNNIEATSTDTDIVFKAALSTDEQTELTDIVNAHVYTEVTDENDELKFNSSGKLLVHQSLRFPGMTTYFTGRGDNKDTIDVYGMGNDIKVHHKLGDSPSGEIEIYFNVIENETWIYEGYINWLNCKADCISLYVRNIAVSGEVVSGGNYDISQGIVLPAPAGTGNYNILGDIAQPYGGLVEMPKNIDGIRSDGYWDADWDSENKVFTNITPVLDGSGKYNMFPIEMNLDTVVNHFTVNGSGTQRLDSEDSKQLSHGLKIVLAWHSMEDNIEDHEWFCAANLTMHREIT